MTLDLEDRLWSELEAAAERDAARHRLARHAAAARGLLPRVALRPVLGALAVLAFLALVVAGAAVLDRPAPPAAAQWHVERFRLADTQLGDAIDGFGSVWTYDRRAGRVLRVDPATHRVLAAVPVRGPWNDVALAASPDSVWAVDTHNSGHDEAPPNPPPVSLSRIDPRSNQVTARVTLRAPDRSTLIPLGVVANQREIWVWGEAGAQRIDPRTNRVTTAISVAGDSVRAFAATDTQAWAVTLLGRMVRFDARTGRRLSSASTTPLGRPQRPVVLPHALLVDHEDGSIAALDLLTGRERWTARPGTRLLDAGLADGRLWILTADPAEPHDDLHELDPETGRVLTRIALPVGDAETVIASATGLLVTTSNGEVAVVRP
jgi:streptogramin lyase